MSSLFIFFIIIPVLVIVLLGLNLLFSVHNPDPEKVSAFECGYTTIYGQTRIPFNIQFYLVAILFLIFDLEIFYLVPFTVSMYYIGSYGFTIFVIFFIVLTIGFVYELGQKVINFTLTPSFENLNS
jgi:NADH:ubiquinone oxidoreductase subunit 3 (subunit A)